MVDASGVSEHFLHIPRPKGQVESVRTEIHSLPPVRIAPDARALLESWDMPHEYIERLRELTSSLRYDLCLQKVERIAVQGGLLWKDDLGVEQVVLPHFFDRKARGDGQCGDIAFQLLNMLHFTGYLEDLNHHLAVQKKGQIIPFFGTGRSRTHFNAEGDKHAWLMLSEGGNLNPKHMILIDPSLREISLMNRNRYHVEHSYLNPKSITDHLQAGYTTMGDMTPGANGYTVDVGQTIVLGTSFDFQFVYSLGFLRNAETQRIQPLITLIPPDAHESGGLATQTADGQFWGSLHPTATPEHRMEIRDLLTALRPITIVPNEYRAKQALHTSLTIRFE